jgi:hypothetical protein
MYIQIEECLSVSYDHHSAGEGKEGEWKGIVPYNVFDCSNIAQSMQQIISCQPD